MLMHATPGKDVAQQQSTQVPLGRLGSANEVAALIAFLLSADAGFITGQVIGIDGGGSLAGVSA